jgi:hypothetical protein
MVNLGLSFGPPRRLAYPLFEMIVDVISPLRPSLKHDATKSATKKGLRERRTVDFPSQQKVFRNLRLHGIGGDMSSLDVLSQLILTQESS